MKILSITVHSKMVHCGAPFGKKLFNLRHMFFQLIKSKICSIWTKKHLQNKSDAGVFGAQFVGHIGSFSLILRCFLVQIGHILDLTS